MPQACKIGIHRTEDGYLLHLDGRGTLRESPAVRDVVHAAIQDGAHVVLDLSDCTYLDSSFLGCLVILHQCGDDASGSFSVVANETIRKSLLAGSHLDRVLTFTEPCPEGLGNTVTLEVTSLDRLKLCRHLFETHRQLAELAGPAADTYRRIAEQLARELESISS